MAVDIRPKDRAARSLKRATVLLLIALLVLFVLAGTALAGDPTGSETGTRTDIGVTDVNDEGVLDTVVDELGHQKIALNFVWMLIAGALVLFMQAGFAMVETGFTRSKNASHVVMTNFVVFAVCMVGFWAVGFPLMFGGASGITALGGTAPLDGLFAPVEGWGLFGTKGFFLTGDVYDVGVFALFFFQLVFMDTAATIPTGALAERWKFSAFVVFGFFMAMFLYPIFGNWVWGGGWMSQLGNNLGLGHGAVDFAGSGVVHAVGGLTALAGAYVLGARIGKFGKDGKPKAIVGHNIPMALLGTFILMFGWFGFNAGSTFSGGDLRISVIVVNTFLAGSTACLVAMAMMWRRYGKPDPSMTANGMLAGLVAITAPCAFVPAWSAALIGVVAGWLVVTAVSVVENRFKVDDPVGAIAVHGACGLWGVLAVGVFADGTYGEGWNGVDGAVEGLIAGDAGQLFAQIVMVATLLLFVLPLAYAFFKVQDRVMGIRSEATDELIGLDLPEMGALAYPDFLEAKGDVFVPPATTPVGSALGAAAVREEVRS
ncbi:MAG: ammonium transporter [Actinomycetota bacterium]|nr:ammonium transporter [Actinomycetota bacterium]